MSPEEPIGLVKFFRNEEFLDRLINGCFHCTPPEVYRLDDQIGVSDKFESCAYSYRTERDNSPIVVNWGGIDLSNTLALTAHNGVEKDAWMHCWFALRLPRDQQALDKLNNDIAIMKKQFGEHYAFVPIDKLKPFFEKLSELSDKKVFWGEVKYSGEQSEWGNLCKSLSYSYQREYRFLLGECSTSEKEYYVFNCPGGFKNFIFKNADLKLQDKNGNAYFELGA